MINYQQYNSRSYYNGGYRYFFNGQEADNEVLGDGALHAFEYRMHDTRIGRFWSVDPLAGKFPWNSTYAFAENSPIGYLELEGLETRPLNPQPVKMENTSFDVTFPSDNTKVATTNDLWLQSNPCGEIKEPKPFSRFELWLETPADNLDQYFIKGLFNFGYSLINAPYTMVFNKTIAGASVTPPQRMEALVSTVPSVAALEIKFSGYFLKTGFETGKGLLGYNNFVKKSKEIGTFPKQINLPPNLKWQTEVGRQFKVNELNYQASEESTKFLQGISILDSYRQVEIKKENGNNNQQK